MPRTQKVPSSVNLRRRVEMPVKTHLTVWLFLKTLACELRWEVSQPLNNRSNPVLTVSFDMLFVTTMVLLMIKLCEIFGSWFHQSSGHHPISFYDLFSLSYDVFHVPLPMLQQSHQHQNLLPLNYVEIIRPSCKNRGIAWAIKAVIKQSSKKKSLEQHQHTCDTYRSNRSMSLRW